MRRLLYLMLVIYGCAEKSSMPDHVAAVVAESDQELRLEEVVNHYQNPNDSLKLKAAYYLLRNMPGLGSEYVSVVSDSGVVPYNTYLKIGKELDTLDVFYKNEFVQDTQQITAEYLISNIEDAFSAWENAKWKDEINFEKFCEYVLPYRFGFESPTRWRDSVYQQYYWVLDSLEKSEGLAEACILINNDIRSWFTYVNTQQKTDLILSFSELYKAKEGSCLGFTGINTFAMRAFGIPVMVDFVPYWADANGGHSWNAVFIEEKLFTLLWEDGLSSTQTLFPYNERGTIIHHTFRKAAKVYRKTFAIEESSLAEVCTDINNIPLLFRNNRLKDVTEEYMPVTDVRIQLQGKHDQNNYAYLCVFNGGRWEGIQWSDISPDGGTIFKSMGKDIVYLISLYKNGRYVPVSEPFHLSAEGDINFLELDSSRMIDLVATKRSNDAYIAYPSHKILSGEDYMLYLWQDNDWKLHKKKAATTDMLTFKNVPSNGLYQLKMYDSNGKERIFMYENDNQEWM